MEKSSPTSLIAVAFILFKKLIFSIYEKSKDNLDCQKVSNLLATSRLTVEKFKRKKKKKKENSFIRSQLLFFLIISNTLHLTLTLNRLCNSLNMSIYLQYF